MSSKLKFIIAGAVVLLLLVGAVAALMLTDKTEEVPAEEETVSSSSNESRLLYEKDPQTIMNINVKNASGEYSIEKYAEDTWVIMEFYGHPLSIKSLNNALDKVTSVTAQQTVVESADDLSIYGLDSPRAEVTTIFANDDGSNAEFKCMLVGDETPKGDAVYMCFKGENKVYTLKSSDVSCFLEDKYYYVSKTVYVAKQASDENDDTDYSKINMLTIKRKDLDYDIVVEYDKRLDVEGMVTGNSSKYVMTSPVCLDLNPDLSDAVMNNVFDLTADSIEKLSPTEEDLKNYGLDDPFCVVDYDIVGGPLHFSIGNPSYDDEGMQTGYYCMAEGIDIVYIFNTQTIPWVSVQPLDITMSMITSTYIYAIESVDVETADTKAHFELNGDSEDFRVESEYEKVTADSFKNFYQYILRAPAEEMYLEDTDAAPDVTVKIKTDLGTDVLEFISSTDRMSVVKLNGVPSFRCRTAYAARLIENLGHLINGEEIITTW